MDKWINLTALGQILVVGLLAGAGLPALVALGLRALAGGGKSGAGSGAGAGAGSGSGSGSGEVSIGRNSAGVAVAGLCFAVVLAAIGYGIYLIVKGGH